MLIGLHRKDCRQFNSIESRSSDKMEHQAIDSGSQFYAQATGYMQQVVEPAFEMTSTTTPTSATNQTRKKKTRTMFSNCQLTLLETTFRQAPYPDAYTRKELANRLGLDETRVQVWFQNRRAKWRKKKALMPEIGANMIEMM